MHPGKDIKFSKGEELKDKKIVLCITGSVGCIKSIELARELMRHGGEVFTVMSPWAQKLISPMLFEWATGNPVVTELTGRVEHISLAGEHDERADLVVIYPATGNTIAKIAAGIDDTPVLSVVTSALGAGIPVMVVPAMHSSMYRNPFLKESIEKLKKNKVIVIAPRMEEGKAKIEEPQIVLEHIIRRLYKKDLKDKKVVITAGPTIEYIDSIRYITNRSSGKMGVHLATESMRRGAAVYLIHGPLTVSPPPGIFTVGVETSEEMLRSVTELLNKEDVDIFISAAAVSDWKPSKVFRGKISSEKPFKIELKPTEKIIDRVKSISPELYMVIFKAEYNLHERELIKKGYERLKRSKADLVVVNPLDKEDSGFQSDFNEVIIIDRRGKERYRGKEKKKEIARIIMDIVSSEIQ